MENLIRGGAFPNPEHKAGLRKRLFDKTKKDDKIMSEKEKEVFSQKLDPDDLDAVAGGEIGTQIPDAKPKKMNCYGFHWRDIYEGGFPNCGSTVGDGSYCSSLDGCRFNEIFYDNMKDCYRAWE